MRWHVVHGFIPCVIWKPHMQRWQIRKFILYEFEQTHNTVEVTKNIFRVKGEGTVDYSIATRWFIEISLRL